MTELKHLFIGRALGARATKDAGTEVDHIA